jgi:hypothetical protein
LTTSRKPASRKKRRTRARLTSSTLKWCASTFVRWRLLKKRKRRKRPRKQRRRRGRRRSPPQQRLQRPQLWARSLLLAWRLLLRQRLQDRAWRRTLPQLDLRRLQALRVLRHLLVRLLMQRRTRLAQRLPLRSLQYLHPRLLLQLPLRELALLPHRLRSVPAFRCDLQQHRARP